MLKTCWKLFWVFNNFEKKNIKMLLRLFIVCSFFGKVCQCGKLFSNCWKPVENLLKTILVFVRPFWVFNNFFGIFLFLNFYFNLLLKTRGKFLSFQHYFLKFLRKMLKTCWKPVENLLKTFFAIFSIFHYITVFFCPFFTLILLSKCWKLVENSLKTYLLYLWYFLKYSIFILF